MLDPGRPEFKVGDHVWVAVGGSYVFETPVRILSIHKHDDGSLWAFVEGAEAAVSVDSLTAAPTDAGAAQDATAKARQEQVGSPNAAAMRAHVEHLFGGYLDGLHDGLIELAWTDTRPDKNGRHALRHAAMFGTDQIAELIAKAATLNAQPMCNVYIGAALRKPNTPPFGRASEADVLALTASYCDLDEPGAAATAKDKYGRAKPTLVVVTGRDPHLRAQPWWRLSEPITDKAASQALLKGMAHALGGDTSVTDPPRVMRLAGTIAWPVKPGRKVEMTEVVLLRTPGQACYTYEHLAAVFPPPPTAAAAAEDGSPPDGIVYSTNTFGFDDKVADGRERYMLRTISACLIEFVGETGKAPTARELFDLAWPQYERNVDFSRPGRGFDEFAAKCAYSVARFNTGKIRGCETIEKTADLYRQRQQARAGEQQACAGQERAAEPPPEQGKPAEAGEQANTDPGALLLDDFYAYMPKHLYIFAPTGDMWPAASVNTRLPSVRMLKKDGKPVVDAKGKPRHRKPSVWLDKYRPVEQMTWAPGEPLTIDGRLIAEGGWIERPGVTTFNLYRPPVVQQGNAANVDRWLELVERLYPGDVQHIVTFCAHRIQYPAVKINHGLLLSGAPGIGKDTILEPLKLGVGAWNFKEVSPHDIMGPHNDYMRSVVLRISEVRDLGEVNRYAFYEHMKSILATPPDVMRVNAKYIPQHYVVNVAGVILTTNHRFDGIYLPPDDRRHYVAGTDVKSTDFVNDFWPSFWSWYKAGGMADVVAYLSEYGLSKFDPKAPPRKTDAFWQIAGIGAAPEEAELADVLDALGAKENARDGWPRYLLLSMGSPSGNSPPRVPGG